MKILYKKGPKSINMGKAGNFRINQPKEVDDKLAKKLLKKETIKFYKATAAQMKAAEENKATES